MYYLRLWILVKAFNRTRNKTSSLAKKSTETITLDQQKRAATRQAQDLSLPLQHDHVQASSTTKRMNKSKGQCHPRKRYLSEAVIHNSSDESGEEDIRAVVHLLKKHRVAEGHAHQANPSSACETDDCGHRSTRTSARVALRSASRRRASTRRDSTRQGPGACKSCSKRHQRCDRVQPVCGRCAELGFGCEFPDSTAPIKSKIPEYSYPSWSRDATPEFGSEDEPMKDSTKPRESSQLQLGQYWSNDDWRLFFLTGEEREIMLATMRSLGLRATRTDFTEVGIDIMGFESLVEDINKIAHILSSSCSVSQLFRHAEDRNYLDNQIDTLFETHSLIWSLDADRTKLLKPGTDEYYPEHLFYEESEDQKR